MDEDATPAGPHARFPHGPALLCAACLAMCVWTWMRYSYAWDVTPERLVSEAKAGSDLSSYRDYFLRVRAWVAIRCDYPFGPHGATQVRLDDRYSNRVYVSAFVRVPKEFRLRAISNTWSSEEIEEYRKWQAQRRFIIHDPTGRLDPRPSQGIMLDTTASRFHGASIAGLVVAAMGAFVFGLYLRMWVKERRSTLTTEAQRTQRTT